jgi:hypothetical protein
VPIVMPAIELSPLPRQALQETVLWPWHLGHKTLFGIARVSQDVQSGT